MIDTRQAQLEPAWILHRYPYRESSLIVEILSRNHGRIGVVARGARRRGKLPLAPFTPLLVSFRQHGELATLIDVEPAGVACEFEGKSFLAACYLNELLLHLLPRDDPAPEVYALYTETLARLAPQPAPAVRRFEGRLLRLLGWMPPLGRDGAGTPFVSDVRYRYEPQRGLVPVSGVDGLSARMLADIGAECFDDPEVLAAAAVIFRDVIAYHLGGRRLKTLDVARALTRNARRSPEL